MRHVLERHRLQLPAGVRFPAGGRKQSMPLFTPWGRPHKLPAGAVMDVRVDHIDAAERPILEGLAKLVERSDMMQPKQAADGNRIEPGSPQRQGLAARVEERA